MNEKSIAEAAALLIEARRSGRWLAELPPACRPRSVADALAVQDAVTAGLGERVGGWKANAPAGGEPTRAALFARLFFPSPARIPARLAPFLCVEAEIAFRFLEDLPPRSERYAREEVAAKLVAFPAIEVVQSRFRDHTKVTPLEHLADHSANGAFVLGAPVPGWRAFELARLHVTLAVGGKTIVDKRGGHPNDDPLHPAVALVNLLRAAGGIARGQVVTTGSFTGMTIVKPNETVTARFEGLGAAEVIFTA